jgi:hypothetical protein
MQTYRIGSLAHLEFVPAGTCSIEAALTAIGIGAADVGTGLAATGGLYAAGEAGAGIGLSEIGTAAGVIGSGIQAIGALNQNDAAAAQQRYEAQLLKDKSNQDAAAGEQVAIGRQRQTQLALSRTQALAAGSGGGATDPGVLTLEQQTAGQGEYNSESAVYTGQAQARSDELQAQIDLFKAQQYDTAGPLAAGGAILSGIGSFADKRLRSQYYSQQNAATG